MTACQCEGCTAEATCILAADIPAKGHDFGQHTPLRMFVGLKLCDRRYRTMDLRDFLGDELRDNVRACMASLNKAAPDFKRARRVRLPLDSVEAAEFEALTASRH